MAKQRELRADICKKVYSGLMGLIIVKIMQVASDKMLDYKRKQFYFDLKARVIQNTVKRKSIG